MASERPRRIWRRACVVRARTVAADVRLLDLAVEPTCPDLDPGAVIDVVVDDGGIVSVHGHPSMPIGPGLMRISIRRGLPEGRHGLRFLWSLVEGAQVKFTARVSAGIPETGATPGRSVPADPLSSVVQMRHDGGRQTPRTTP
jgi:hypothetical protein